MASMLLTPFTVNGSYVVTSCSVFEQGIQVLEILPLYIYIMNSWLNYYIHTYICKSTAVVI